MKSGAEVVTVRVEKGEVIFVHWTEGWPRRTSPKARVLLGVVVMAVPVPVRLTRVGEVLVPEVTESRPWRVPGCEGAKVMRTVQVVLPGRVAGQSVVKVKSPVRAKVRGKGCVPMLPMVTD